MLQLLAGPCPTHPDMGPVCCKLDRLKKQHLQGNRKLMLESFYKRCLGWSQNSWVAWRLMQASDIQPCFLWLLLCGIKRSWLLVNAFFARKAICWDYWTFQQNLYVQSLAVTPLLMQKVWMWGWMKGGSIRFSNYLLRSLHILKISITWSYYHSKLFITT